jgi:hypothetical protein
MSAIEERRVNATRGRTPVSVALALQAATSWDNHLYHS